VSRAQAEEYDDSGLFSLSPLSSPEPSPPPSPISPSIPISDPEIEIPLLAETSSPSSVTMTPIIPAHQPVDRVKKRKRQSHNCRSKRRAKEKEDQFSPYEARPAVKAKYVDHANLIHTSTSVGTSPVASTAYVALDNRIRSKRFYRLDELVGPTSKLGLMLQEWDGMLSLFFFVSRFLVHDADQNTNTYS
jgi:hypothetical protein